MLRLATCTLTRQRWLPANAASIRSRMQCCMDSEFRCCDVEGAKIYMSRWRRSHQNGADVDWFVVVV